MLLFTDFRLLMVHNIIVTFLENFEQVELVENLLPTLLIFVSFAPIFTMRKMEVLDLKKKKKKKKKKTLNSIKCFRHGK